MDNIKEYVLKKKLELKKEVSLFSHPLKLVIVQVNDDEGSNSYIRGKINDLIELGVLYSHLKLDNRTTEDELLKLIDKLNKDQSVTGFIVQLPLPKQINEEVIKRSILPEKDIDGFNPLNTLTPATPKGVITYLKDNHYEFSGKNAVIIGRSNIVGKPMHKALLGENMNVVILHTKTSHEDFKFYIEHADLIISACGVVGILNETYHYKKNAVILDVGITRIDGVLRGDALPNLPVAFQSPVPGGVGLLTRLALLINLLEVAKNEF